MEQILQTGPTTVRWRDQDLIYFGGCDYLRMAWHPKVRAAASRGVMDLGLSVAASRATTGNHPIYCEVETALAKFIGRSSALVLSTGYAANIATAQSLEGTFTDIFIDEKAHPSLVDASKLLRANRVKKFSHRDANSLAKLVSQLKAGSSLVVMTDGIFAHDGSWAPLGQYRTAMPDEAWLWVDDSHGAGIIGPGGRGLPSFFGIRQERLIHTCTLSKSFGSYGGVVFGDTALIEKIVRTRAFIGGTPPPLPCMSAALVSLELLLKEPERRDRLERNGFMAKQALIQGKRILGDTVAPIIGLVPRGSAEQKKGFDALLSAGIYPSFIQYPGGAASGYFRIVVSSEHTPQEIDSLAKALSVFL